MSKSVEHLAHRANVHALRKAPALVIDRMIPFGESLPGLRAHLDADLRRRHLAREKVLALVVKLLEETLIRVGNTQYTEQNGSYGLTTLCDRHIDIHGASLHFELRGKSGVEREVDICDRRNDGATEPTRPFFRPLCRPL